MKQTLLSAVLAISLLSLGPVGCTSQLKNDPVARAQAIDDAAVALRIASRGAVTIAIQKSPGNTKYVQLAVTALDQFVLGGDYTPGALAVALAPVVKEANDPEVKLAIGTVSDLYEIFYGRFVTGEIASSTAVKFIKAIRDGAAEALPTQ